MNTRFDKNISYITQFSTLLQAKAKTMFFYILIINFFISHCNMKTSYEAYMKNHL